MPLIDLSAREIADRFHVPAEAEPLTAGALVPLARLVAEVAAGAALPRPLGLALEPSARLDQVAPLLDHVDLVALGFPKFRDGRGFTLARALRERHGFRGEIRATGHLLPDQFQALRACGVSTIEITAHHPAPQWQAALAQTPAAAPRQLLNRMLSRATG